jgi:hypothetical protein
MSLEYVEIDQYRVGSSGMVECALCEYYMKLTEV